MSSRVLEMNWQKCADLHNQILDIGWATMTDFVQGHESWWESHFSDSTSEPEADSVKEQLEQRLAPSLIKFLQTAKDDYPGSEHDENFFYYLKKLVDPKEMIMSLDQDSITGVPFSTIPNQYVKLYSIASDNGYGGL